MPYRVIAERIRTLMLAFFYRLRSQSSERTAKYVKHAKEFLTITGLFNQSSISYVSAMSTVREIEAAIPKLSRVEIEEIRDWIDDYLEDRLELTDDVKVNLDQSRAEIAAGQYTTRQPE